MQLNSMRKSDFPIIREEKKFPKDRVATETDFFRARTPSLGRLNDRQSSDSSDIYTQSPNLPKKDRRIDDSPITSRSRLPTDYAFTSNQPFEKLAAPKSKGKFFKPFFQSVDELIVYYRLDKSTIGYNSILSQVLETFEREKRAYLKKIGDLEAEVKLNLSDQRNIMKMKSMIDNYNDEYTILQGKIHDLMKENCELKDKLLVLDRDHQRNKRILEGMTEKYKTTSKKCKELVVEKKRLEEKLQELSRNTINQSIYSKIDNAKNVEEFISSQQELNDLFNPSEDCISMTQDILNPIKDEIARENGFTKPSHSLVAVERYAQALNASVFIDDKLERSQDPSELFNKLVVEANTNLVKDIKDETTMKSMMIKSVSDLTRTEESNLMVTKIETIGSLTLVSIVDKSNLYLTNKFEMLEDELNVNQSFQKHFPNKEIISGDIKVYKDSFFKYFQINMKIFLEKIKIYDIQKNPNPRCLKHQHQNLIHFKHFGFEGHKFNLELQYPGQKDIIKTWPKAYYAPIVNKNDNVQKIFNSHLTQSSENVIGEVQKNTIDCMEYAAEAEKSAAAIKFEHNGKIFFYKVLFMVRVNPMFMKQINVPDPLCNSNYHKKFQVEGLHNMRNIRMITKVIDEHHKMNHDTDCYLCNYLNKKDMLAN